MSQKDFMGAEDAEWMERNLKNPVTPTDVIISGYENKISQSIASKILSASRRGVPPEFTKEELLYLNKRADETDDTELKVITPTPAITIKKGKTELNIGHAAVLVQKMEEKYPTGTNKTIPESPEDAIARKSWRKATVYNDKNDIVNIIENPDFVSTSEQSLFPQGTGGLNYSQPTEIKSVNKNAYEIRESVLSHALDWIKFTHENRVTPLTEPPNEDIVLTVAQKFYKFVENKR